MPIERDRERAKRRYVRRQANLQARAARRRRRQQVVGAVVAVLVVAGGVLALTQLLPDDQGGSSAASTPTGPNTTVGSAPTPTNGASSYPTAPPASLAEGARWKAEVTTNRGPITLELYGDKAPQTVASFLFLSRDHFYDDTSCHRLTTSGIYVLQCGDPTGTGSGGPGYVYGVENAPKDGAYPAGTLAMARGQDAGTNGSQFFMVYQDSKLPTDTGGYTVFGKVTEGLDVIKQVAAKGSDDSNQPGDGKPKEPVTITSITVEKQ